MWNQSSESLLLRNGVAHTAAVLLLSLTGQQPMSCAEINLVRPPTSIRQEGVLLPAKSAIIGKVILDIVLDPDRKHDLPVTMITSLPVYDQNGVVALPTGTLVTALI